MQTSNPHSHPILVTGGAGFIGSNFVRHWLNTQEGHLINLDALTYSGNLNNLKDIAEDPRYTFVHGDVGDREKIRDLLHKTKPRAVLHFAAETHVDRSIKSPEPFVNTNVVASYYFLEELLNYWKDLEQREKQTFRFLNISTDEVFGSLEKNDPPTVEDSPYRPNSPYSASKAAFNHLVRAYHVTFGLPAITTYCSNNFGPYQFPEKLIPLMVVQALQSKPLPVYGDGKQMRNWLYVEDHCKALSLVLEKGVPGSSYNIGSDDELDNLTLVNLLCSILDELLPTSPSRPYKQLIQHVADRPGHDRKYALDSSKIKKELGWAPTENFEEHLRETVQWYLRNFAWVENVLSGDYRLWMASQYE